MTDKQQTAEQYQAELAKVYGPPVVEEEPAPKKAAAKKAVTK